MFRWLIGVIVLVIVAYFVIHEVLPSLESSGTAPSTAGAADASGGDDADVCIAAAADAYDVVVSELGRVGPPPVDASAWSSIYLDLGRALAGADRACVCFDPGCGEAAQAVDELRGAIALYDGMTRMDAVGNPATYFERAGQRLAEARSAAASAR